MKETKSELNVTYLVIVILAAKWFGLDAWLPSPDEIDAATRAIATNKLADGDNITMAGIAYVASRLAIKWKRLGSEHG